MRSTAESFFSDFVKLYEIHSYRRLSDGAVRK